MAGRGARWRWALSRPPSVEDAAEDYLRALSEGDYATIAAMIEPSPDAAAEATAADAFAGASYGTEPEVEEITRVGDGAAGVRASLELGGDRHTVFFAMELRNGRWAVTSDYLGVLDVSTTVGDSVWVGDALVPVGEVALLPAVYPVSPAPRGDPHRRHRGRREQRRAGRPWRWTRPSPTTPARIAQEQLDAYLDDCTAAAATVPEACGIRIPWAADLATLEGLTYRIEQRPTVDPLTGGDDVRRDGRRRSSRPRRARRTRVRRASTPIARTIGRCYGTHAASPATSWCSRCGRPTA